jgi:hypothetical protein
MRRLYETEEEIERVVRGFETCATPDREFHHREHLTVAVWYLQTLTREETVEKMREALFRFIDHHGVDRKKYSEEITVFWIREVSVYLGEINAAASLVEKCNRVLEAFNSPTRTPTTPTATAE